MTSYYMLGYYSTTPGQRRQVPPRQGVADGNAAGELAYRQGYFGDKEFAKFTAADKERQLEEALMLDNPVTEITIAMEVNYFQLNSAEYFVPVAVKIPGSELALARRRGAPRTLIDFIGEIKDDNGIHHAERARQAGHQAERRHRGAAGDAADPVRNRLHAAAGQVRDQAAGARRRKPAASAPIRRRSRSRT